MLRARRCPSLLGALVLALAVCSVGAPADARSVLRIATLLPRGSSWMRGFLRFARQVKKRTRGQVVVHYYPGAIMGDERDMVRKMRRGRLQGAALTGTGMGLLLPAVRILELPLIFSSAAELDAVRARITPELSKRFRAKGFIRLAWGDVGWIRFFSRDPHRTLASLRRAKFWAWIDDTLALQTLKTFKLRGVPLAVQDVLPSLQTGVVNSIYGSAYTTLALQWHTHVRYVSDIRVIYGVGGLFLTRRSFERLGTRQRRILVSAGKALERHQVRQARRENRRAFTQLKKIGIRELRGSQRLRRALDRLAPRVWKALTGRLFKPKLLRRVLKLRGRARAKASAAAD